MAWFNDSELDGLVKAAVKAKLVGVERRSMLFADVHEYWYLALVVNNQPLDQLRLDLMALNREDRLTDGTVPFLQWLNSAVRLAGPSAASETLAAARDDLSAKVNASPNLSLDVPVGKELVLFEPNYLPAVFLQSGARKLGAVGKVEVPRFKNGKPCMSANNSPELALGTGFLVARGVLLTVHHNIDARGAGEESPTQADWDRQLAGTNVRFDFNDRDTQGIIVGVAEVIARSKQLDYCLLALSAGDDNRPFLIEAPSVEKDRPANIIQHPAGSPKQVVVRNNVIHAVTADTVQYFTDTEGGSSGSPVCDDEWRVMALHRAARRVTNITFQGKKTAYVNEGTPLSAIVADAGAKWAENVTTKRG